MQTLSITAQTRESFGRKTNKLREEGNVPAVVYGFEIEPINVTVARNDFDKLYEAAGESTVIDLEVDGNKHSVLIQDIQRNPLTDFVSHIDFRRINMDEKIEAEIELVLEGVPPAVKELGGTLVQVLEEVEVMALPAALVRSITVNVEGLKTFDDMVRVSDLQIPDGIEVLSEPDETVALVQPPRSEKEMEALDEVVEENVEAVEVASAKDEGSEEEKDGVSENKNEDKK
ncbi:MAG: 50S ribosomal protein L25 [Patescibacteria group bacterium]